MKRLLKNRGARTGVFFGATSGVITTVGLIAGLHAGTESVVAVLGGILVIAVADAMSDALGIHIAEEANPDSTSNHIWAATFSTFVTKFIVAISFAVPILWLPLDTAVIVSIVWGLIVIALAELFPRTITAKRSDTRRTRAFGNRHRGHRDFPLYRCLGKYDLRLRAIRLDIELWLAYVTTVLILMSTPGPSHLLMLSNSLGNGFRRSLSTAVGDLTANIVQMIVASLGVVGLVQSSQSFFTIIKWAGVCYLIFMGVTQFRKRFDPSIAIVSRVRSLRSLYWQGFMTSAANPKAIIFFAALFPQFMSIQRQPAASNS